MRIRKRIDRNAEVRRLFDPPRARGETDGQKPVRARTGGLYVHGARVPEGSEAGFLKAVLIGALLLMAAALVAGIVGAAAKLP